MRDRLRAPSGRCPSVKDDWRAWLPEAKDEVFRSQVRQLEISYNMLSVALDEALSLRQMGRPDKAGQAVLVAPELCDRFAHPLEALLLSLGDHAKHYGTVPNAAPLDPDNFQGARGQRAARISSLLCKVLFSARAQFLHKLSVLAEMVEDLNLDFCSAASGISASPWDNLDADWQALDATHYDLNTCLRETIVVLKSFLLALAEDQLDVYKTTLHVYLRTPRTKKVVISPRLVRHRRIPVIEGE
ncbi:MAG TPA: hypothetical protein VJN93_18095 [Candidatus Acidoferrum sp.]|nr:hypothetical protein [Candidatus Acidoferrum sp.]